MCLRLDMLGYRIATHWFSDLSVIDQKRLYQTLYNLWNHELELTDEQKRRIVPDYSSQANQLFRVNPNRIITKHDMDSMRRTNLNIIERLISSASEQSDKTLAAMYTVMALAKVSNRCRQAYPWLAEGN
jgi:heme oxygenase